jgi:L-asparaginase
MTPRLRARVLVISLGGTIASTTTAAAEAGVVPQLTARDLISAVPELSDVCDVDAVSFRQVPSGDLTFHDVFALARVIDDYVAQGFDGVVVTQGTDTIEETSFALDVLISSSAPVVVTGAMRNPTLASPDGPGNLLAAARVAASPQARGLGCLVVMNDEAHAARFVRKMHSSSTGAFQSPNIGPIGWVVEERVRVVARLTPLVTIDVASLDDAPAVALVSCALDDDGRILGHLEELGFRGCVIDSFGAGHVPSTMVGAIESLASAMPVILCSRTGGGEVLSHTYGFPGSESDLLSRGATSGGALDGRKARVALTLALAVSSDAGQAREHFARVRDSLTTSSMTSKGFDNDARGA